MGNITTNIGSTRMKFGFTDADGEVCASFKMNPVDIKLLERLNTIDKKLEELQKRFEGRMDDMEAAIEFNNAVEELFCYVLGYDVRESLFGLVSAISPMEDGRSFYEEVWDTIERESLKEIQARSEKMQNNIRKYTEKYTQ